MPAYRVRCRPITHARHAGRDPLVVSLRCLLFSRFSWTRGHSTCRAPLGASTTLDTSSIRGHRCRLLWLSTDRRSRPWCGVRITRRRIRSRDLARGDRRSSTAVRSALKLPVRGSDPHDRPWRRSFRTGWFHDGRFRDHRHEPTWRSRARGTDMMTAAIHIDFLDARSDCSPASMHFVAEPLGLFPSAARTVRAMRVKSGSLASSRPCFASDLNFASAELLRV